MLPDDDADELMRTLCDAGQPWTLLIATGRRSLQEQCARVIALQAGSAADGAPVGAEITGARS
jgi:hypothetical protein